MITSASVISFILILHLNVQLYDACPKESLAVYHVHLETYWHRRDFPKHYPEWRPPASWSKTLGFSHDSSFEIFCKGSPASEALKQFIAAANSSLLEYQTQDSNGIFDSFTIAPLKTGAGEVKVVMTADGNHTKVSLVTKMLPSPDWFIGVDSYNLCPNGRWLEYVHLEADPLDAGTDDGLTFTSPNRPTHPEENIQPITAHFPDHPAGSFYYPELDNLPVLAHITITKQREFVLRDTFDAADYRQLFVEEKRDIYRYKVDHENPVDYLSKKDRHPQPQTKFNGSKKFHSLNLDESSKYKSEHQNDKKHHGRFKAGHTSAMINAISSLEDLKPFLPTPVGSLRPESKLHPGKYRSMNNHMVNKNNRKKIPTGDVMAVIDDIVKDYQKEHRKMIKKRRREERKRRREHLRRIKPPRDCQVSDWTDWTTCSKSCGIGEQSRTRAVIKHSRRGGKLCPLLEETTWCGSARACTMDYFN